MVMDLISAVALLTSAALAVPTAIYTLQCVAGSVPPRRDDRVPKSARPSVAVIVPAHNEEISIRSTLEAIRVQLSPGDRLLVVADNCDDRTAELASKAGAEVIERIDGTRRGKGYALDAGIRHLAAAPCSHVMIIDADCDLDQGAVDRLVSLSATTGKPAQGKNLMKAPAGAPLGTRVAEFAYVVKNMVRPTGMMRLGLPCQLMGTGMVIPWDIIRTADLAHGHIVEDMQLCIDLAQSGHAPIFCPEVGIISYFPQSRAGANSQRRRWEGGHLRMIGTALGCFLKPGSIHTWQAFVLLLDRLVPPLTVLFLMVAGVTLVTASLAILASVTAPFLLSAASLSLLSLATAMAWFFRGREIVPLRAIGTIPAFVVDKLLSYPGILFGKRDTGWVRTDRRKTGSDI